MLFAFCLAFPIPHFFLFEDPSQELGEPKRGLKQGKGRGRQPRWRDTTENIKSGVVNLHELTYCVLIFWWGALSNEEKIHGHQNQMISDGREIYS